MSKKVVGTGESSPTGPSGTADSAGISVAREARSQVEDQLDSGDKDLGDQKIKNVAKTILVDRVLEHEEVAGTLGTETVVPQTPWRLLSVVAVLIIVIGGAIVLVRRLTGA